MSLLYKCVKLNPSSFVFVPLKASSIDREYTTTVLLANSWHQLGIGSWQRFHPIRIIDLSQALDGTFGLLADRVEYITFLYIRDH